MKVSVDRHHLRSSTFRVNARFIRDSREMKENATKPQYVEEMTRLDTNETLKSETNISLIEKSLTKHDKTNNRKSREFGNARKGNTTKPQGIEEMTRLDTNETLKSETNISLMEKSLTKHDKTNKRKPRKQVRKPSINIADTNPETKIKKKN
ncbi:uncharacterized protein LOC144352812 [Saccoglossus kowalevskii]